MENIKKRLGNLLAVKSLVTITLTVVFAVLALRETISGSCFTLSTYASSFSERTCFTTSASSFSVG